MTWRNNKCESDSNIECGNEVDLLGSQLADKLLVFVPMKKVNNMLLLKHWTLLVTTQIDC